MVSGRSARLTGSTCYRRTRARSNRYGSTARAARSATQIPIRPPAVQPTAGHVTWVLSPGSKQRRFLLSFRFPTTIRARVRTLGRRQLEPVLLVFFFLFDFTPGVHHCCGRSVDVTSVWEEGERGQLHWEGEEETVECGC